MSKAVDVDHLSQAREMAEQAVSRAYSPSRAICDLSIAIEHLADAIDGCPRCGKEK